MCILVNKKSCYNAVISNFSIIQCASYSESVKERFTVLLRVSDWSAALPLLTLAGRKDKKREK